MKAADALELIRRCVDDDELLVITGHFYLRMEQRGLFWTDVLAVIEEPDAMRTDGHDEHRRERWFITATAPDELPVELLCAIDSTDPLTVLVTIYWE